MSSVQEPGIVTFYKQDKSGNKQFIYASDVSILGPGGSADGVKASTANADNQLFLQPTGPMINTDETLLITFKAVGADGVDASDCFMMIPITKANGTVTYITEGDLTNPNPADYTTVAGLEITHGGYKATEPFRLGGSYIFLSIEDDTS